MKKLLIVFFLLLAATLKSNANTALNGIDKNGIISGRVLDAKLNLPLPYVNVIVKNTLGNIVTGGITLDDGTFKITKVPEGNYMLTAQYIGYKSVTKVIVITKGRYKIELGDILLVEEAEGLDEITVIGEVSTIQQKVDRKVITIGKDLAATGSASDIMVGIPSIGVDPQTGNISMRGNENVRVMVDGKLSSVPTTQLLKQIPSTAIKSIELITNPSAKYNPEGMSGIINIILHKNTTLGFNGNTNVSLAYEKEPKFNSAINMNYRNGKLNLYGNYSNDISKNDQYGFVKRIEQNSLQNFNILENENSHLFKLGIDFYLNDKNTISFFTNQNIYDEAVDASTDIFYNDSSFDQTQNISNQEDNTSSKYNFDYKLDFNKEGRNLELEIDHNIYDSDSRTDNAFFGFIDRPNFYEMRKTESDRTTINLDYLDPISEKAKLELGVQARLFENNIAYESNGRSQNEMGDYIPSTTNFNYQRDIYSAYITYSKTLEKWSYQLGVRAENVEVKTLALETDLQTNAETIIPFNNDYFEIYPSGFIRYAPSEKNTYQLSYSRRIDRPGIGQVNPLPDWNTPLISEFGNQRLLPQFTNSIETNYTRTLKNGNIIFGLFYRQIKDEITTAIFVDRSNLNRIILSNDNFDDTSAYGLELSSNYRPVKWWNINASFDVYSQRQRSISERLTLRPDVATEDDIVLETVEVDNIAWSIRMFNNLKVNKKLSFTAFGYYRGKTKSIQFDLEPITFVNLGMRYSFLDDKANFSLNYNDIFNTQKFEADGGRPFDQMAEFNQESQTIQAALSYRFGSGKYKALKRKRRDRDELSGGGLL